MNKEFEGHMMNEAGKEYAKMIAGAFDMLLESIKMICPEGRELSIVKTKLEEACLYAKKSIASNSEEIIN